MKESAGARGRAYFAAVNGRYGFKSFFEEIFFGEKIKRRYIIKGGPGTGKSSFMRRIALHAENRGAQVEYFYCSSDTGSLDGIIIDSRIAVFDGTAPHSCDTALPGAIDEIVNLGAFWNADCLAEKREELIRLGGKKRTAYSSAYGYLRAAGETLDAMEQTLRPCVNTEKMKGAAQRIFSKLSLPDEENGGIRTRQISAFGVQGKKRLGTLETMATALYRIEDYYGTAHMFLGELAALARDRGAAITVSYNTTDPSRLETIYFDATGDCFICGDTPRDGEITVNMKRFVDPEALGAVRYSCRAAMQVIERLCELAGEQLSEAGRLHGQIEKIYVASMDFEALGAFCEDFMKKLP